MIPAQVRMALVRYKRLPANRFYLNLADRIAMLRECEFAVQAGTKRGTDSRCQVRQF